MMSTTRMNKSREAKRFKAKRMYVYQFYSAKEAAKKVGVTEKTVGKWIKDNNWKQLREDIIHKRHESNNEMPANPATIIEDLRAYIEENSPTLAKKVEPIINNYLTLIP